ncbi:hypothetical protein ACFOKI_05590 [Sphingomonas qilianensis]|uniref:Terminase small subunit n=1 Tax=Sphingomonas qilianensis TaxID=1736690 RepID=A0ABU9XTI7_9SPHN
MADIGGSNGCRVQQRATRKGGWTTGKRTVFLATLAATCNVTAAARAAGKSDHSARALRKRDGEFSLLWAEALEVGYERLENELVARALGLVSSGDNPTSAEIMTPPAVLPAFDPALAIQVLKLRSETTKRAGPQGAPPVIKTQGEVDAALLQRLDALAARRRQERGEDAT